MQSHQKCKSRASFIGTAMTDSERLSPERKRSSPDSHLKWVSNPSFMSYMRGNKDRETILKGTQRPLKVTSWRPQQGCSASEWLRHVTDAEERKTLPPSARFREWKKHPDGFSSSYLRKHISIKSILKAGCISWNKIWHHFSPPLFHTFGTWAAKHHYRVGASF